MRRPGLSLVAAAAAIAAIAACSNGAPAASKPAEPSPAASAPAAPARGTIVKTRFTSEALGVGKDVVVYLPAGYDTHGARRWPVFYYLHGLGGEETNWLEGGKLDAAADALALEAIVVMPDGDDGFYADSARTVDYDACMKDGAGLAFPQRPRRATCVRHHKYETYITRDLVGWVDRTYRTIAAREGRAIAGLSMGGFGALHLAMRHRELFAAAASHSGLDALLYGGPFPYEPGKAQLVEDVTTWGAQIGPLGAWIRGIFGADLATWQGYDPASLAAQLEPGQLALYLDCGTEDDLGLQHGMQYLHDVLRARGIEHAYHLGPGKHDFSFWRPRLPHSLAFLRDHTAKPR